MAEQEEAADWFERPMLRDERLMREALDRLSHEANVLRIGTIAPAPLWHLARDR